MSSNSERMRILQMIEDGQITAAEGLRLLQAMGQAAPAPEAGAGQAAPEPGQAPAPVPEPPAMRRWQRWWMIPMSIGIVLSGMAALGMYWAYRAAGFGFWFYCAGLPFMLGVLVMALAAATRTARWLHVRVKTGQDEWPRNIAISLPVPIQLTAWLVRIFGPFIPKLKNTALDELILAMGDSLSADAPLYVEVDEGENGEQVQVYMG